ncbi:MAG: type II toxin-antitoxin system prevent-host-death family antitoxin [Bacteroidales bacterium]|nr:type II toxin-antitoxin system prevent-host-death family antitoxin [Bacteroidales bacterium]
MITTTYSHFRGNLKSYLDRVTEDVDSVVINRENGKAVVVISMEEFEAMQESAYLMKSPKVLNDLAEGEKAKAEGRFKTWTPHEL